MSRPARKAAQKPAIVDTDEDDDLDNSEAAPAKQGEMSNEEEDILITAILKWFDAIENKATDKSLNQSNKKNADATWEKVQAEFEQKAKVSGTEFRSY